MPRHEQLPDEAIEMRSVLMRLYHSRQMGEAFYPAAFVNGHAPQMEADGWIEWCGQGWRMTEEGLKVWARMNPTLITYKFQNNKQMFEEMRQVLRGEEEMSEKVCVVEGCGLPQYVTPKGERHYRCEKHQKEQWREDQQRKSAKKADKRDRIVDEIVASEALREQQLKVAHPLPMDECEAVERDCEHCEAKAIIGMLKARSPKLAALIEAMEATQRTAAELGL